MPGFNGTGPMGMGPMTGGSRGQCNPYSRPFARMNAGQWFGGNRGRGRAYRHMYWATGLPGWKRFGPMSPWGSPSTAPYTKEQEVAFLKGQTAALEDELNAVDSRLRDLESEERGSE